MNSETVTAEEALCEHASAWVVRLFRTMRAWPSEETAALREPLRAQTIQALASLARASRWSRQRRCWHLHSARSGLIDAEVWLRVAMMLGYPHARTSRRLLTELVALQTAVQAAITTRPRKTSR